MVLTQSINIAHFAVSESHYKPAAPVLLNRPLSHAVRFGNAESLLTAENAEGAERFCLFIPDASCRFRAFGGRVHYFSDQSFESS
jgi:hypothetical protein